MDAVVATVIGVGLLNLGALIFFLGGMKEKVNTDSKRIDKLETRVDGLAGDVAAMKG